MAKLAFGNELRDTLLEGIKDTAKVITPNYGPSGRNTFVEPKLDIPMAMSRGGQILQDFSLDDPLKQLGSAILCQGVQAMADHTGDGISATVVLCNDMLCIGQKILAAGANPIPFRKGLLHAAESASRAIWNSAIPANDLVILSQIARNSARQDDVADLMVRALKIAGADGVISVEDSQQREATLHWGGIQYDYGWLAPEFANDTTGRLAQLQNPYVLLMDKTVESIYELQTVLEGISQKHRPLLIIAADMKPEVLRILLLNVKRKSVNIVVSLAPGHGDSRHRHMEALAARLGAVRIDAYSLPELKHHGLELCAQVASAQVDKHHTQLSGLPLGDPGAIAALKRRIIQARSQISDPYELDDLQLTLAILSGQAVTIRAGGISEVAMFEQKRLLEQALAAVHTARETGVLPGGGKGFLLGIPAAQACANTLSDDEARGAQCVVQALKQPTMTLAENAGHPGSVIVNRLLTCATPFYGFDARQNAFVDLAQQGILDPAGSIVGALSIAAETAATILTVDAAVY